MSHDIDQKVAVASFIKERAKHLGFDLVGIAASDDPSLQEEMLRYRIWISKGYNASMAYLSRHEPTKANPALFLPQVKSVVSVAMIYGSEPEPSEQTKAKVSIYTRGLDYHEVIGKKLAELCILIEKEYFGHKCRSFVDANPVLDRFWAWRAGLGWLGKNTCLINRKVGSYVFLGGLMTTLELPPDGPAPDHCGRCSLCIQACPTGALREPHVLDSNLCIAYHTIENRSVVPTGVAALTGQWIAGCDICQSICPWNDPITKGASEFHHGNQLFNESLEDLLEIDEDRYKHSVKGVAMGRMKYVAFLRNLAIAISNSDLSNHKKHGAFEKLRSSVAAKNPEDPSVKGLLSALDWAQSRLSF